MYCRYCGMRFEGEGIYCDNCKELLAQDSAPDPAQEKPAAGPAPASVPVERLEHEKPQKPPLSGFNIFCYVVYWSIIFFCTLMFLSTFLVYDSGIRIGSLLFALFALYGIHITNKHRGKTLAESGIATVDRTVYYTPDGECYHYSRKCIHTGKVYSCKKTQLPGLGLRPCSKCCK